MKERAKEWCFGKAFALSLTVAHHGFPGRCPRLISRWPYRPSCIINPIEAGRKIKEYEKNGLPFPFSFVIVIGVYVLFQVKIFAAVKNI